MKKIVISALAFMLIAAPVAFAQLPNFSYPESILDRIIFWSNRAVTFLMVVATLYFIWAVIKYITDKGDKPENVAIKRGAMIRGIIGLAVIVGIWGIVRIITNTVGVQTGIGITPACAPGQRWDAVSNMCR